MNLRSTPSATVCIACALSVALLSSGAQAAMLIGTVVTPQTESVAEMNQLIADFNADFGASLPDVDTLVDKLEGQGAADFTTGNLALSDFNFYHQLAGGPTTLNVFNAIVAFTPSSLGPGAGFDTLDNPVLAFEQLSGPSFDYYVSKDGNLGWSLWARSSGLHPAYTDSAVGGFTRGSITNTSLEYDPIKNAVSHISFYRAVGGVEIPEPGAIALAALSIAGLIAGWRRRQR